MLLYDYIMNRGSPLKIKTDIAKPRLTVPVSCNLLTVILLLLSPPPLLSPFLSLVSPSLLFWPIPPLSPTCHMHRIAFCHQDKMASTGKQHLRSSIQKPQKTTGHKKY